MGGPSRSLLTAAGSPGRRARARAGSASRLFTLDAGTYVLDDGTCVLNHIHVETITYVQKQGVYYAKECLPICLKLTETAKKDMDDATEQLKKVKASMEKAEDALVAGEQKLYDAQAAENDAKVKYDDTWKVRYSKREVPLETYEAKKKERAAQQEAVVALTKTHYLEEKKYNEWVVARDEKIKVYDERMAAAATCARVEFPIGSEGKIKQATLHGDEGAATGEEDASAEEEAAPAEEEAGEEAAGGEE